MKETNYTIKEDFELPSKGLIYSKKVNPHVELRSMTTRDEMKRTNPTSTPMKNQAEMIENCMIEKPAIHVWDMALGDYEYLLHKLRIVTYGPEYKMVVGCPHCDKVFEMKANLDELKVQEFDLDAFKALQTVELPVSGKTVTLRFQTPRMIDEINNKSKAMKAEHPNSGLNYRDLVTLMCVIETVDTGRLTPVELEDFCMNLSARDSNTILNRLPKMNMMLGLDTKITTTCDSCGGDIITYFRVGPEFFRPSED